MESTVLTVDGRSSSPSQVKGANTLIKLHVVVVFVGESTCVAREYKSRYFIAKEERETSRII